MQKYIILIITVLLPSLTFSHLCNDVFRQSNKWVIEPEVANIIVKDTTSFKVFLTNNMDRELAEGGLEVVESKAFDVKIKPYSMKIDRFAKVSFDITLKLKKGINPGVHDIAFKLVGRGKEGAGREVVTFCFKTSSSSPPPPPLPISTTSNSNVKPVKNTSPTIDGKLDDDCWKETASFTNFYSNKGGKSKNQTVVLLTYDQKNLYIGSACTEEMIEKIKGDKLCLFLAPKSENGRFYKIEVNSSGKYKFYKVFNESSEELNVDINTAIAVDTDKKVWFIEMRLPLNILSIGEIRDKDIWKINIMRFRFKVDGDISFWSGTFPNADIPKGFGKIQFIQ